MSESTLRSPDSGGASTLTQGDQALMPTETAPAGDQALSGDNGGSNLLQATETSSPTVPMIEGVSGWQNDKRVSMLWSINQDRNVFMGVAGVGWKKLADNSGSAIVALTMLSAHAREKGSVVRYREESDGKVHEMYVW